ncbi:MAG: polysaccharide biosynthesis protein PslG [Thermoleophilaceae bacterium]|nr:polysaccharide biosynthesis protein PslG [Thermoleophilaceae bacterium]
MSRFAAIALALACLAALTAQPAAAHRTVPSGFYGVDYDREIAWAKPKLQSATWGSMAKSGVESARVIFDWRTAQPVEGQPPSFTDTDRSVALAAAHGVQPLPVVMLAPAWARVLPKEEGSAPSNVPAYTQYLRALVARYGPAGSFWAGRPDLPRRPIRNWQVWNEPDVPYQWSPRDEWQKRYGELLRPSAAALRDADPGAKVVLAALTNDSWVALDQLYEMGDIRGSFDAVALNAYTRVPSHLIEILRRGREVMNQNGASKLPIFVTEFGASASKDRITAPGNEHLQTTDKGLAHLVTRMYQLLIRHRIELGVRRAYWYTWASSYDTSRAIFDFAGLMRYRGGKVTARPAAAAYKKSALAAEGCKKDAHAGCKKQH